MISSLLAAPNRQQVIALSGVFQAAMLVYQLANKPTCDESALKCSVASLLRTDADTVESVFSNIECVGMGCGVLNQVFSGKLGTLSRPLFQYSVAMHQLAMKLLSLPHHGDVINQRLVELSAQFPDDDYGENAKINDDSAALNDLCEQLAGLYAKTISTMEPRIMVQGSEGRLSNPVIVNRVRSSLFAGVRAAFLWHQLGGRRWHLMFHKRHYQSMAQRLSA
ncbi:MAG: lysogenization regulator HflD [Acidiferrobacterales bacterium]|nr:lysogenization regulator HflD [Acidiferrobacterales bacterium]